MPQGEKQPPGAQVAAEVAPEAKPGALAEAVEAKKPPAKPRKPKKAPPKAEVARLPRAEAAPGTVKSATARARLLAARAKVNWQVWTSNEEKILDPANPQDRAVLEEHGISREEIDDAAANNHKYAVTGETLTDADPFGRKRSTSVLYRHHDATTVYHEYAHAYDAQVGIKGEGTEEARAARYAGEIAAKALPPRKAVPAAPGTEAEKKQLRQRIHAVAFAKGLSKKQLSEISTKHGGFAHTTAKGMGVEQLKAVLAAVEKARPRRVKAKRVVMLKTERKIAELLATLKREGRMTDGAFREILDDLHIREPRYVSAENFITETQGKDLLKRMLDDAVLIEREVSRWTAMKNPKAGAPGDVAEVHREIVEKERADTEKRVESGKPAKVSTLWDMRYYAMRWEERTGGPFYDATTAVLDARNRIDRNIDEALDRLHIAITAAQWRHIQADPKSLDRIERYLASDLRDGPDKPTDILPHEVAVAEALRAELKRLEPLVRLARFYDVYYGQAEKPRNVTAQQWTKAVDIYESRGPTALSAHIKGETWGVISKGYTPLEIIMGRVREYRLGPTAFGKGHIKTREGVWMAQERNILERTRSAMHQILALTELRMPVRAFVRIFDQHSDRMDDPRKTGEIFSRWLEEVKGKPGSYHPLGNLLARGYAQSMAAVVLVDPRKALRNLFQNLAFYPDKTDLINPLNRRLTKEEHEYFREEVSQKFGLLQHYFLRSEKPFWGLGWLNRLADRIGPYPLSDDLNRAWCFWAKLNRIHRALEAHPNDTRAMMRAANMLDLEHRQQQAALEILAKEGKDAMARWVAKEITFNVHFAYLRSMRAPIEHGNMGRVLANLMTFPRSYGQQMLLSMRRVVYGQSFAERYRGMKQFVNLTVFAWLAGRLFQAVTGRPENPYDPASIFNWTFGGLSIGAAQDFSETMGDMLKATMGNKQALARCDKNIPRCADLFVPFYSLAVQSLEAATGMENVDVYAVRRLRALVDKRYGGPPTERYKVDRNAVEVMQKVLLNTRKKQEPAPQGRADRESRAARTVRSKR